VIKNITECYERVKCVYRDRDGREGRKEENPKARANDDRDMIDRLQM